MIKVELTEEPNYLHSEVVDLAIEKLDEFYASKNRGQSRYNWPFNSEIDNALKPYLYVAFNEKCGYCETGIPSPQEGTIDRYRPNNGVRDKDEYSQDLYWWLTFEWNNLVYCCKECNQYKANYFPIDGIRANAESSSLEDEKAILLNPLVDLPELHLTYDERGQVSALTKRGNQTIELLRLNRTALVNERINLRRQITDWIEVVLNENKERAKREIKLLKEIYEMQNLKIPFLGFCKSVIESEIESVRILGDLIGLEEYQPDEKWIERVADDPYELDKIIRSDYFPIEYIHIKNFKSIVDLRIHFKPDELNKKSWIFLLGENGVGKSSILQAIAIGLQADRKLLKGKIPSLITKGKRTAEIEIKERDNDLVIRTTLTRKDETIQQTGKFRSYLIGYGSLRLSSDDVTETSLKDVSRVSYDNLFRSIKPLNDVTKWLRDLYKNDKTFFDRVAYSIRQLLPHDFPDKELTIEKDELMFKNLDDDGTLILKNSEKRFNELSDGFRSTIILAVDIMMKLSNAQTDMDKMSGVVLIDELGNQLHPRWQMRIVKQLRNVFPNINFVISTHHPLCLRGAEDREIFLLKNFENEVIAVTDLPSPASLRVDQLLASEFFGLNSLVDPEIEAKFNQYYRLLAKADGLDADEQREVDALKDELRNKQQMGGSLREELFYTIVDKVLAQKVVFDKNPLNREQLKIEVVNRVEAVWRNLNLGNDD